MPQPDIAPGFIVIHGNQSETLRDLICDWMRAHPLAPLENEVILVQSNGIAQWLTLSARTGHCGRHRPAASVPFHLAGLPGRAG